MDGDQLVVVDDDDDGCVRPSRGGDGSGGGSPVDAPAQQQLDGGGVGGGDYGCAHYRRKARLVAPCCERVYTCRFCHDDSERHQLDRHLVSHVECMVCGTRQPAAASCCHCHTQLAQYYCDICHLYEDVPRGQYHCHGCGICRVGGRASFFHCPRCDTCLPKHMEGNHKCVERASRTNCAVCLEDIHTSRMSSHVPPCGHMIHQLCYRRLVKRGYYACPFCSSAMFKMESVWEKLDSEVAQTQMPRRYRNCYTRVLCNDCHTTSLAVFHVIGLKCAECGSYNTARTDGPIYRRTAKGDLVRLNESDASDDEDEDNDDVSDNSSSSSNNNVTVDEQSDPQQSEEQQRRRDEVAGLEETEERV